MTSPQCSLLPATEVTLLCALELLAGSGLQLAQAVGTLVDKGVSFEPVPQIFHRIHARA